MYIIHNDPTTFKIQKIINHKNLDIFKIYKFKNDKKIDFPNLNNSHVSEATYYRLFIDEYLPQNLDKIVYLDADVICNENPINILNQKFEEITDLKYAIGVFTTPITKAKDPEIFNRLQISSKYFNAGVMMIDLKMWNEKNISENLLLTLQN